MLCQPKVLFYRTPKLRYAVRQVAIFILKRKAEFSMENKPHSLNTIDVHGGSR